MKLEHNEENFRKITSLIERKKHIPKKLEEDKYFTSRYQHSDGFGIFKENKLVSYIMTNIFNCRIFRKRTKMAAIGYVVSEGEEQKNIGRLLKEIFNQLHRNKIPVANLETVREKFFRTYSFENTKYQKIYQFKQNALKGINMPKGGTVKVGTWKNLIVQNGAAQLYEVPMHTTDERNTMNRPYWWWNRLDEHNPKQQLAVYFGRVGLSEAYMFFKKEKHKVLATEIYGNKANGVRGLLAYLKQTGLQNYSYRLVTPVEKKLENYFPEQHLLSISCKPYMMTRIVNLNQVLESLKLVKDGTFIIGVSRDDFCPWNIGNWKITQQHGKITVQKVKEAAGLTGTINSWTKVFLGNLTVKDSYYFGELDGDKYSDFEVIKGNTSFYDRF